MKLRSLYWVLVLLITLDVTLTIIGIERGVAEERNYLAIKVISSMGLYTGLLFLYAVQVVIFWFTTTFFLQSRKEKWWLSAQKVYRYTLIGAILFRVIVVVNNINIAFHNL